MIFRHLSDKGTINVGTKEYQAADIDGNNTIEIVDAIWIFRYLAGKITLNDLQNIKK